MDSEKKYNKKRIFIGLAILLAIVAGVIVYFVMNSSKKATDKQGDASDPAKKVAEKTATIVKVGDEEISLEDMLYYIYSEEEMGSYYDQVYTSFYEASYWDMPDEENNGKTGQELSKENVLQAVEQDAVFYQEAIKTGYTLSEDDKKDARENYDEFCSELTDDQLAINGMGAELLEYFERQILIDKYKDSLIEQSDFDYDKVASKVSKKDCRQYTYEYYCIYKTDDNDEEYPAEQINSRLETLKSLKNSLTADNDMESLVTEDMADYVEYAEDYIVEEDGEAYGSYKGVNCDKVIKSLKNGEISDIVETEFGYFVFRMSDNNSEEYYNEMIDEKVNNAKTEIYNTVFDQIKGNYGITVDEAEWAKITLKNIVYDDGEEEAASEEDAFTEE